MGAVTARKQNFTLFLPERSGLEDEDEDEDDVELEVLETSSESDASELDSTAPAASEVELSSISMGTSLEPRISRDFISEVNSDAYENNKLT